MNYSVYLICNLLEQIKEAQKVEYNEFLEKVYTDLTTILTIISSEGNINV